MADRLHNLIGIACEARKNCQISGNAEWLSKWDDKLDGYDNLLPSGSGFDSGSKIDRDNSSGGKIAIKTSFHHMDTDGYYDGWTEHTITIRPSFSLGLTIVMSGKDRNEIKNYIAEVFECSLSVTV